VYQFFAFHRSLTFLVVVRARALAISITYKYRNFFIKGFLQ
jgi:hypothetical protein